MFFGVEIILREFAVDALFTVMLSAMIADVVAIPFLGDKPFLSGFPAGITLGSPRNYLLVAVLAVIAALMGLAFKSVLYKVEDWCDALWKGRPEWARPAVLGLAFGLLLLALPQMYGVGYPVMFKTTAGDYAIWFLIVLAFGKILATSVTMGIGGSGGIFAPSLFIGVTTGMAYGDIVDHLFGAGAGQPALYAVVAMGAVFTAAARAPLTSLASVVEMTGDFSLTLPVMLAVAIATTVSRALSYGTIYTTKLLRRGTDIDRAAPWRALADLKITDVMRPIRPALPVPPGVKAAETAAPDGAGGRPGRDAASRPGRLPARRADAVRLGIARPGAPPARGLRPGRTARGITGRSPSWKAGSPARACCERSPAGSPARPPRPRTRRPPPTGSTTTPRPCLSSRPPRCPATTSPRSPSPGTRRRPGGNWATSAGRRRASRCRCCGPARSAQRTAASPWLPATASACSSPPRRTGRGRTGRQDAEPQDAEPQDAEPQDAEPPGRG